MKKYLLILVAVIATVASCQKEKGFTNPEDDVREAGITFNLTANHPDPTKAVKTGWESGDAIFVFFSNVASPKHLKMTFDGTSWSSAEYDGATATPGALGLKNGDSGTMRAVFLPFGSSATVSADGTNFVFSKTYYTYYSTATLDYTVADNKVSGAFNMLIPEGYLQLFVADASATDEAYTLGCDAVITTGISTIAANGTVTEATISADLPGYAYGSGAEKGYLFSGKLNTGYGYGGYCFAKTKVSDGTRQDYFVKKEVGKELTSHCAIKLPANNNVFSAPNGVPNYGKWVPVGSDKTVAIGSFKYEGNNETRTTNGIFQTCNYLSNWPEDMGTQLSYDDAFAIGSLPTKTQYQAICEEFSWIIVSIHGRTGRVVQYKPSAESTPGTEVAFGFILLPIDGAGFLYYWSHNIDTDMVNTENEPPTYDYAWKLEANPWMAAPLWTSFRRTELQPVRFLAD